jgi:hypothetical protein
MPSDFIKRRHEIAWKYQLTEGNHNIRIRLLNPKPHFIIRADDFVVYSSKKR